MNIRTDMHIHPYTHPHLHVYIFTCNYVEKSVIMNMLTETPHNLVVDIVCRPIRTSSLLEQLTELHF